MRDFPRLARCSPLLVLALVLASAPPAAAQVQTFIGRPVAEVRLVVEGRPTDEPELRDVVETPVGQPLEMQQVRETIIHLMALSRFENVVASAQPSGSGVSLTYELVPLRTVGEVVFRGRLGLSADTLASEVTDRYGASPPLGRAGDIAALLEGLYRDHGYADAHVTPHPTLEASGRATLAFDIDAGPRAKVGTFTVKGDGLVPEAELLRRLDIRRGSAYDPTEVTRRASEFQASLRSKGFYTAEINVVPRPADAITWNLDIDATRGPRVTVQFTGDPMAADRLAQLVPAKQENSVDRDLVEDWSNNVERYLQLQGYRDARVTPSTAERPGELRLVFDVKRGPRHVVGKVDVAGATSAGPAAEESLRSLRVQAGQPFVLRQLEAGLADLTARYQAAGFMTPAVQPTVTPHTAADGTVVEDITVTIVEGPRTIVGSVRVFVNGVETDRAALPHVALATEAGKPFYPPLVDADRERLLIGYLDGGYQMAAVAVPDVAKMVGADRTRADVRFDVRPGPKVTVDHILVVGNNRTKTSTIRQALTITTGAPLSVEQLNQSQQRVSALGLFRRVRISELQHGSETRRDVLVVVEEAPATSLAYGGGVEGAKRLRRDASGNAVAAIELAPRGLFEVGRRNLWGKNRSVNFNSSLAVRPSSTSVVGTGLWEYRALGTYREPSAFRHAAALLVTGGIEQTVRTSYSFNRRSVRAEVAHRLSPVLSLYGRYSIERTRVFNEQVSAQDQLLIDKLFPLVRISKVSASIVRDTRDDSIDPGAGMLASVDGDMAPRAFGSEVGFTKGLGQLFLYHKLPTTRRLVFAAGARLGLAFGFGQIVNGQDVRNVPISERFFSGSTVRGFIGDRLGRPDTLTADGFPKGGNGLLILNGELRVSIWKDLAGVLFADAGNVYALASEVTPSEMRLGLGFGLRYKSPIGPIRIDLGFNPWRHTFANGTREPLTAIYFGIGQAF